MENEHLRRYWDENGFSYWEGNGFGNAAVYHLFALPDETVLHVLPGAWDRRVLLEEIAWVRELAASILDRGEIPAVERNRMIRNAHGERARYRASATGRIPDNQGSAWRNPAGLLVETHRLHARKDPPTVRRMWEVARRRIRIATRFGRIAVADMGCFYENLGEH